MRAGARGTSPITRHDGQGAGVRVRSSGVYSSRRIAPVDLSAGNQRRRDRLEAIRAAKARREQRQREADEARGRRRSDERIARDEDGNPRGGGRYQRDFGVPRTGQQHLIARQRLIVATTPHSSDSNRAEADGRWPMAKQTT